MQLIRKTIVLVLFAVVTFPSAVSAQGGGGVIRTPSSTMVWGRFGRIDGKRDG